MKNYTIYFPDKNFDILVHEINEKAEKKERKMKTAANLFQIKKSWKKISHQFQIFNFHQLKTSKGSHLIQKENFFGKKKKINKIRQKFSAEELRIKYSAKNKYFRKNLKFIR